MAHKCNMRQLFAIPASYENNDAHAKPEGRYAHARIDSLFFGSHCLPWPCTFVQLSFSLLSYWCDSTWKNIHGASGNRTQVCLCRCRRLTTRPTRRFLAAMSPVTFTVVSGRFSSPPRIADILNNYLYSIHRSALPVGLSRTERQL